MNIGSEVMTKNYGKVKILEFDPRFPKTYSISFVIKENVIILHNISERELLK